MTKKKKKIKHIPKLEYKKKKKKKRTKDCGGLIYERVS